MAASRVEYKSCYAAGCAIAVRVGTAPMCVKHWATLAPPLRQRVWQTYFAWKAGGRARPYLLATLQAKLALARIEGVDAAIVEDLAIAVADMEKLEMEKEATI